MSSLTHPRSYGCTPQLALEDSLVTMSTIQASRFVAGIRGEVDKVDKQLSLFAETLEQWVQVGRHLVLGRCWCERLACTEETGCMYQEATGPCAFKRAVLVPPPHAPGPKVLDVPGAHLHRK